jgi:hypothetical protein
MALRVPRSPGVLSRYRRHAADDLQAPRRGDTARGVPTQTATFRAQVRHSRIGAVSPMINNLAHAPESADVAAGLIEPRPTPGCVIAPVRERQARAGEGDLCRGGAAIAGRWCRRRILAGGDHHASALAGAMTAGELKARASLIREASRPRTNPRATRAALKPGRRGLYPDANGPDP